MKEKITMEEKLTENFSLNEFDCRDGTPVPTDLIPNVLELAKNLQIIRNFIQVEGAPEVAIHINSGYRTYSHNISVGGELDSQHLEAKAGDLSTRDYTPRELYIMIQALRILKKIKFGWIKLYPGFVHYDIR